MTENEKLRKLLARARVWVNDHRCEGRDQCLCDRWEIERDIEAALAESAADAPASWTSWHDLSESHSRMARDRVTALKACHEARADLAKQVEAWEWEHARYTEAAKALEAAKAENEKLRQIISACSAALNNGSFCSTRASLEFMAQVPVEIALEATSWREGKGGK